MIIQCITSFVDFEGLHFLETTDAFSLFQVCKCLSYYLKALMEKRKQTHLMCTESYAVPDSGYSNRLLGEFRNLCHWSPYICLFSICERTINLVRYYPHIFINPTTNIKITLPDDYPLEPPKIWFDKTQLVIQDYRPIDVFVLHAVVKVEYVPSPQDFDHYLRQRSTQYPDIKMSDVQYFSPHYHDFHSKIKYRDNQWSSFNRRFITR